MRGIVLLVAALGAAQEASVTPAVEEAQEVDGGLLTRVAAPALGVLMGNGMFAVSAVAVSQAQARGSLGALNPAPYPLIFLNCVGWTIYGLLLGDHWVFWGNAPGALMGLWFTVVTVSLCEPVRRAGLTRTLVALVAVEELVLYVGTMFLDLKLLVAASTTFWLLCYYASPLLTVAQVLREKDSASLDWRMCAMSVANGATWAVYGYFVMRDPFYWASNAFGFLVGAVQCGLIACFPARDGDAKRELRVATPLTSTSSAPDVEV